MCDYSLHGIKNRLAEEGETLVVHRFRTGSKGLTSMDYLKPTERPRGLMAAFLNSIIEPEECAVCVPDGAKLLLLSSHPGFPMQVATFRQLSTEPETYRDAVEFENGTRTRLQDLNETMTIQVLSLSPADHSENSRESSFQWTFDS